MHRCYEKRTDSLRWQLYSNYTALLQHLQRNVFANVSISVTDNAQNVLQRCRA